MTESLSKNDFTLYQEGGKLMSGGFQINTSDSSVQKGGGYGDLLDNLSMPLYYFSQHGGGKKNNHNYEESTPQDTPIIDNELFDKLLGLVKYNSQKDLKREKVIKKRGTRKHIDNPGPNNKSHADKSDKSRKKTRKNNVS